MNNKAFTLIELIIVIAIIAILAALSFVAVNPGKRIGQAQDDERLTEARSIEEAIEKYTTDNRVLPPSIDNITDTFPYMITSINIEDSINCGAVLNIAKVNIGTELENYLPIIPIDPNITDESIQGTGYYLVKRGHNIQVSSCLKYNYSLTNLVCGGTILDERDDQKYATIQIGGQCWLRQNLNIGTIIDGNIEQDNNGIIEKYCYDDEEERCSTILHPNYPDGGFYQWNEAMAHTEIEGTQGLCMADWHIPTDNEYKILEMELGMSQAETDSTDSRGTDQGTQLKFNGLSGFEGNLVGYRHTSGSFNNIDGDGYFWTSSEYIVSYWTRKLNSSETGVIRYPTGLDYGWNIRCLKD